MRPGRSKVAYLFAILLLLALSLTPVLAQETTDTPDGMDPEATAVVTDEPTSEVTAEPTSEATPDSTAEVTESPTAEAEFITYIVQPGDTLFRISVRFGVPQSVIAADNNITNSQLIFAGQQLRIRTGDAPPPAATTPAPTGPTATPSAATYIVQPGDTLFRIATRFNTTVAELVRLNNLPNPNAIFFGQQLIISEPETSAPAQTLEDPGFAYGIVLYPTADSAEALTDVVTNLGMTWVKIDVSWREIEATEGERDFTMLDAIVNAFEAQGLNILFTVADSPAWARQTTDENGPPDNFAAYADFVGELAARYAGRVDAYQIWSEPNLRREWNSALHPISAASYIDLLTQAFNAIKAADPAATVVSAGLAPTGFNDGINALNDRLYLNELYASGLAEVSDAIAAHPGGWANPPDSTCCNAPIGVETHFEDPSFYFLDTLNAYRETMLANNDGGTPIWVTEFGWGTSEDTTPPEEGSVNVFVTYTSLAEQAIYVPRAFELGQELGFVGPMFLYNLNGCQAFPNSPEFCYYSLLGPSGSPRPVYSAVQAIDKDATPTPPPIFVLPTAEATSEATSEATPEATSEATSEATPDAEETAEATATAEPEVTDSPAPDPAETAEAPEATAAAIG